MFLHIGSDFLVNTKFITGIFDLDLTTVNKNTRKFLDDAQRNDIIISVDEELPKSFIISNEYGSTKIYLTSLSCSTLKKRLEKGDFIK